MKIFRLLLFLLAFSLNANEVVNLWSGRDQTLPGNGAWSIAAEHGRILASGDGTVRFELPALADGATLDTVLTRDGKAQKVRFHSPKPLTGIYAGCQDLPKKKENRLIQYGLPAAFKRLPEIWFCGAFPPKVAGRLFFVFADRRDFPQNIGNDWESISLKRAKNPGRLSVLYDKKEQSLGLDGDFTYAMLRKNKKIVVVFSPEFDLEKIENVLLLKQLVEENEK